MMLKYLIQTSIFRYSKNYGSLTHETRIKDAVNMGDLKCLLATVRTLKQCKSVLWKESNGFKIQDNACKRGLKIDPKQEFTRLLLTIILF